MSEIYRIYDKETGNEQLLVSKEYVDLRIKALKDAILSHIQNIDKAHTDQSDPAKNQTSILDNADIVDIDLSLNIPEIPAEMVKTDPMHRFITHSQLEVFKDKPTTHEVETMVNNNINYLKNSFNEMYARLLNMPDAVKKLREIAKVVQDDENLKGIYDAIDDKVTDEEFADHLKSNLHLNNVDRKSLNLLLSLIQDGTIDKVKSVSLDYCNSAFNSYHLDGKTPEQIRSRGAYHRIYSVAGYNENEADYYFYAGEHIYKEVFDQAIYNMVGKVLFRECDYDIPEFIMNRPKYKDLIIEGCGNGTNFIVDRCYFNYVQFDNCAFSNASFMQVLNSNTFRNVQFDNCKITLDEATMNRFIDCIFNNCEIRFNKVCTYNRFSGCIFNKTKQPKYAGGNNIFSDNIENL